MQVEKVPVELHRAGGRVENILDTVAVDTAFCIFINYHPYRTLVASPTHLEELALGHLLSEGVINKMEDVTHLEATPTRCDISLRNPVDPQEARWNKERLITTACSSTPTRGLLEKHRLPPTPPLPEQMVFKIAKTLNTKAYTFKATGGTHSALLISQDTGEAVFAEDVGRHNAVDKVLGMALKKGISLKASAIGTSGRLSGEVVLKAAVAGVPHLVSLSAPLYSALKAAQATGISLVGFVRGSRFNKYT